MAISTGAFRRVGAQNKAMKLLADKVEKEKRREGRLGGLLGVLSPLLGMGATALIGSTGGLLAPLLKGATTSLFKKWTEEGLRSTGMGMKESNIKAEGRYGYGKSAAAEQRKLMREGRKDRGFTPESLLADVGMSYLGALTPKMGIDPATGELKVTGGELARQLKDPEFKKKGFLQKLFTKDTSEIPTIKTESIVKGLSDEPIGQSVAGYENPSSLEGGSSYAGYEEKTPIGQSYEITGRAKGSTSPLKQPPKGRLERGSIPELDASYETSGLEKYYEPMVSEEMPSSGIGQSYETSAVPTISESFSSDASQTKDFKLAPVVQDKKDLSLMQRFSALKGQYTGVGGSYGIPEGHTPQSYASEYLGKLGKDEELFEALQAVQPDYLKKLQSFEGGGQVPEWGNRLISAGDERSLKKDLNAMQTMNYLKDFLKVDLEEKNGKLTKDEAFSSLYSQSPLSDYGVFQTMFEDKLKGTFSETEGETLFGAPLQEEVMVQPRKKYEGGGQVPSVAEYFGMQGKSLGGSNKKSLAEMLGRR